MWRAPRLRRRAGRLLGLGLGLMALAAGAAEARMGGELAAFEQFMESVPGSEWKTVPDEKEEGALFAGRIKGLATILRVYQGPTGAITRQKVEVALPVATRDDFALAIITRFAAEFAGRPQELRGVMDSMRAMRKTIMNSGRRTVRMGYRKMLMTLSLDSSTTEFSAKTIEVPWGMLYWKAELEPLPTPTPRR